MKLTTLGRFQFHMTLELALVIAITVLAVALLWRLRQPRLLAITSKGPRDRALCLAGTHIGTYGTKSK